MFTITANNIPALPAIAQLAESAYKVNRVGNKLRFRFRRTGIDTLPGVGTLLETGLRVRVYTGQGIWEQVDGEWIRKPARRNRPFTTVEVCLV